MSKVNHEKGYWQAHVKLQHGVQRPAIAENFTVLAKYVPE